MCHHCSEDIEGGACVPVPINGSGKYHYFHPECLAAYQEELEQRQSERLDEYARLARTVN